MSGMCGCFVLKTKKKTAVRGMSGPSRNQTSPESDDDDDEHAGQ